jgi:DNA helicase-2/ATP-dependent DNA helicase PcrA
MKLNKQQIAAVKSQICHVLVDSGSGTGKTETITGRAAYLIETGVKPERILMMTFTRRAAREMIDRLSRETGPGAKKIMAGTFHHFCLYWIRRMSKLFGLDAATVIDRDDQLQLMKLARAEHTIKGMIFPKAKELCDLYSYARNTNQSIKGYLKKFTEFDEDTIRAIKKVFADYEKRKDINRYLDYDDILFHFAKRLHEDPVIRKRLRGYYDHILVDEMQDTNPLQWSILDGLRDPAVLFCVGDPAQSIFAFRGADFKNVNSFSERIPDSKILRLEKNYRSTQEILDLSNWLLGQSPLNYKKRLKAHRGRGIKPKFIDFESEFDEAGWIADDLIARYETGASWKDHMIITRTAYASRAVEAAMIEKKIPYRFIGGTSFLQAAHIKDLLCLIRATASHHDELAWVRYLTLWPRIGDVIANRLITKMRQQKTLKDALKCLKNEKNIVPKIIEGIDLVLEHWDSPSKAIKKAAGFLSPILECKYERWENRKKDFDLMVKLAGNFKSLLSIIETYTLDPISTTEAERLKKDDIVTLITVHSAKGTEAPVCYLIRVEPGMYPHVRSIGDENTEEEERRVLYVAMTRTMNELIITRTCTRYGHLAFHGGFTAYNNRNRTAYFLDNVPDSLVDTDAIGFDTNRFSDY